MVNKACTVPITQQVRFPVFHSFPLFSFDSFESPWLVTYFGMCWSHDLLDLTVWQFYLFCLFSHLGGISFCRFESRPLPFPFSYFSILVPRGASHLRHGKSLVISSFFLLGLLALVASTLFLVFFSCPFLSNCLNLPLTVLMRLEGSAPLGGCWGSWLFSLISCHGFLFLLDASSFFFGLQASWACHFFSFVVPLHLLPRAWLIFFWAWLTSLGLGTVIFFKPQQRFLL